VLENRTLFPQITLLPPASLWTFQPGCGIAKDQYFHPREWEEQEPLEPEFYYEGLKDRFQAILPRYFNGDQRCGISLTGGVDSRLIMAWRPPTAQGIRCYSFGGPIRDCADVTLGRKVATALGSPHEVLRITHDFFKAFPDLAAKAAFISDGTMDATGAVELFVNAAAREIAPVRITGNYGGEILRRTVAFGPRSLSRLPFVPEVNTAFETAAATYRSNRVGHPLSFIAFKQVPWHHYSRLSIEQSQLTVRSPFLDNDLVQHVYRAPGLAATEKGVSLRLINDGHPELRSIPTDRGLRYQRRPLLDTLSQKWIGLTVKAEYACDYGMPQWAVPINRALETLRPDRLFLGRHKFYHFRSWYRLELGSYLDSTLLASRTLQRSHFDAQGLRTMVESHINGKANYTTEINRVLAIELMQRQLLDASGVLGN
jgi:asparagine synthase (glutamine-hydrolysing)